MGKGWEGRAWNSHEGSETTVAPKQQTALGSADFCYFFMILLFVCVFLFVLILHNSTIDYYLVCFFPESLEGFLITTVSLETDQLLYSCKILVGALTYSQEFLNDSTTRHLYRMNGS